MWHPGLIDMRVQSADPGAEHLDTLESSSKQLRMSGITSLVTLPDTNPVIDNRTVIDSLSFVRLKLAALIYMFMVL